MRVRSRFGPEDRDDASPITQDPFGLSSRPTTSQAALWSPGAWGPTGQAGTDQRSTDFSAVIEEVVSRPGWRPGQSILLLLTGSGTRTAESFDGAPSAAPRLEVIYR